MLRRVASLDHPNMLKFFEKFEYQGSVCLVFEVLHKDLWSTVNDHDSEMKLSEIRPIAAQVHVISNVACFLCSCWNSMWKRNKI